jgi:hypothetical protein
VRCDVLFTARLPSAALAARCTSRSGFCSRNRIGSSVSRSTSLTSACGHGQQWFNSRQTQRRGRVQVPRSVISAKVKLADRCKSMLSEYTRVLNARRGSPEKKSVSARWTKSVYGRATQPCKGGRGRGTFSRKPSKSATASRSLSASTGS